MFEKIVELDRQVFQYLNSLGSPAFDGFWLFITHQFYWIPLFIYLIYLLQKYLGWKEMLVVLVVLALVGLVTDQTSNLFKEGFARLRPNNDPSIKWQIRFLKYPQSYSFISGHASNSIAIATFIVFCLRRYTKNIYWLYLWPLIFAYSRIYLGLHFPLDIIVGYLWGILMGVLHFKGYRFVKKKLRFNT